jgi:hypothetical protein
MRCFGRARVEWFARVEPGGAGMTAGTPERDTTLEYETPRIVERTPIAGPLIGTVTSGQAVDDSSVSAEFRHEPERGRRYGF